MNSSHITEPEINWRNWCRLCANEESDDNISIFFNNEQGAAAPSNNNDLSLPLAIGRYFRVNVTHDDNLPTMICTDCFSLVTSLVNLTDRISRVQQMFTSLLKTSIITKIILKSMRIKHGLLDDERELILRQQPMPEVHYFETKPRVYELEEKIFENDSDMIRNPLEQARLTTSIKKENILELSAEELNSSDVSHTEEGKTPEEDPFNSDFNDVVEDYEHNKSKTIFDETSRSNTIIEITKRDKILENEKQVLRLNTKYSHKRQKTRNSHNDDSGNENSVKTLICTQCPRKYKRIQHCAQHKKRSHLKVPSMIEVNCPQCSRKFSTQNQLLRHSKVHLPIDQKKIIPCKYCNKKFTSNTLMQTHIKYIHMNERPFVCEECGEAVRTNVALKTHMLTHTDYAPFECEVCKKKFKNKIRLKNHMETHDPNKHICAECGLQLNSRATLNRHLLVHSDEMQHKCDFCGRAFKRAKALKNHLILHTGLKPYSCNFCDRTFANGSNCRTHKKKAHPQELAALEASGGGRIYTTNIPKLEALKAVTKTADNLTPVVSKQSGRFAFGKKPKSVFKSNFAHKQKLTDSPFINMLHEIDSPSPILNNVEDKSSSKNELNKINNIYHQLIKQATTDDERQLPSSINILEIKKSPSQQLNCNIIDHKITINSLLPVKQLSHTEMNMAHNLSSPDVYHNVSTIPPQDFYAQMLKQSQEQQLLSSHNVINQHSQPISCDHNVGDMRSSENSQTSQINDELSNTSTQPFYNHLRQSLHHGPYI